MTQKLNSAHVHKWGEYWTKNMGIFELSKDQIKLMIDAHNKDDYKMLLDEKSCFNVHVQNMNKYIKDNCKNKNDKIFFRLSTLSPKDVRRPGIIGPILYANNIDDILDIMTKSDRVAEDLEDFRDFAIILNKWNNNIDMKNEYRCFIFDNVCECIVNTYTFKKVDNDSDEFKVINDYIESHKDKFPEKSVALDISLNLSTQSSEKVIFIEFNCVDNELDTFEMDDIFSEKAKEILKEDPKQL